MDNPTDEQELMIDLILTRDLVEAVAKPGCDGLDSCNVSLLKLSSRNALLITCYSDDFIPAKLYTQVMEIARFVHQHHGRTHICLRHHQKGMILRWDSESLLRSNKPGSIHPSEWLL